MEARGKYPGSVYFYDHVVPVDQTWVIRLDNKYLYLLSHFY